MKSGDYMIHVYIQSGKNFVDASKSETVNPIIEVTSCGITQYTQAKDEIPCKSDRPVNWGEHLFIEPRNIHESQIS